MLIDSLNTPQLIQYSAIGGTLKEIVFATSAYDAQKFSLDVKGTFKCTNTSVIDNKYYVASDTKVLYVPMPDRGDSDYDRIMNNPTYYNIYTGSYFVQSGNYTVSLYDIDMDCKVKYAVVTWNPRWSKIYEAAAMLAVTGVGTGVDSQGRETRIIYGFNESGDEVEFEGIEKNCVIDPTLNREAKPGDVVQYRIDFAGNLAEIKILHNVDDTEYYVPMAIEPAKANYTVTKVFGEVIRSNASRIMVSCKPIWQDMSPLDSDRIVSNTGSAIYKFDNGRSELYKVGFDEISRGDKIFACVNGANKTRMLVIYE